MQGYWENGKYILASTQQRKIEAQSDEVSRLRAALMDIYTHAPDNGEDVSFLTAKAALSTQHGQNGIVDTKGDN